MGLLDEQLVNDMVFAFTDLDGFGESVIYKPRNGTARTITAIVIRNSPAELGPNGLKVPRMVVKVPNHATLGISSAEINYGGDRLNVDYRKGGIAEDFSIHKPDGEEVHDAGMLTLILN